MGVYLSDGKIMRWESHSSRQHNRSSAGIWFYRPNKVLCLADDLARSANDSTSAACQGFGI
jgi:hypothetical protein